MILQLWYYNAYPYTSNTWNCEIVMSHRMQSSEISDSYVLWPIVCYNDFFIPPLRALVPTCNRLLAQTLLHYNHNDSSTSGSLTNSRKIHQTCINSCKAPCRMLETGFRLQYLSIFWQALIYFWAFNATSETWARWVKQKILYILLIKLYKTL